MAFQSGLHEHLSYCFPSVGLSGLIHEMVKLPSFIDYLKVRASWAEVGSPIPWGISYLTYKWKQGSWSTSATRPIQISARRTRPRGRWV